MGHESDSAQVFPAVSDSRASRLRSALPAPLLLLLAGLALVLFFRLGAPAVNNTEDRCFEPAERMIATGEWLVPYYHGEPRLHKPPLYTWLAAGVASPKGELTPLLLRLPSALAALGLAAVVFVWGRQAGGRALGLVAAFLLALMVMFLDYGRRGVAEMVLALFSTVSLVVFYRLYTTRRSRLLPLFGVSLGVAFLAKATAACLLIGLPILVFLLLERDLRKAWHRNVVMWIAGGLLIGAIWYLGVLLTVPGAWDLLRSELLLPVGVETEAHTRSHYEPPYYFLPALAVAASPAIVLLPLAIWRARVTGFWRDARAVRFAAVTFVSLFVAFSILPQKHRHYLLPLLPALALVLADGVLRLRELRETVYRRWLRAGGVLLGAAAAITGVVVAFYYVAILDVGLWAGLGVALAGVLLGAGTLAAAFHRRELFMTTLFCGAFLGLELVYQGSFSVWRSHFDAGTVASRDGFDAARWRAAFDRYPSAVRVFEAKRFVKSRQGPSPAAPVSDRDGGAAAGNQESIGYVKEQP